MARKKQLSKKQFAVINDLFGGELNEEAILAKHKISRRVYIRWLTDNRFEAEFSRRIAAAHRQSELIIAKYAPLAAAKLVQLTESEKEETARKACLNIISLPMLVGKEAGRPVNAGNEDAEDKPQNSMSPEVAGKLLAVLAENSGKNN
jgi:hypothetical protein